MFAHAPLTNVSMFIATYMGFVWKVSCFCPQVELLQNIGTCRLQTSHQHRGHEKDICAHESQVLSCLIAVNIVFKL